MQPIKTFSQAYDFLFQFVDFSLTHQEQIAPERFELERMFQLMSLLDEPQKTYPAIHIAGTKGKGSVAAHCAAALQAGGLRTGLYTSPHLVDFRERIQVDGEMIPEAEFVTGMRVLQAVVDHIPGVTSYELQTALALWYFALREVAVAVVEVGMGGRLDSTNILTPLVAVIANISYDHTAILGDTLAAIAGEKAGIIKEGVPVICAPQQSEALEVIWQKAAEKHAPLTVVGEDLPFVRLSTSLSGQNFTVGEREAARQFSTRLLGPHQVENAVVAYGALRVVQAAGLPLTEEDIRAGFAQVRWPGRFEVRAGNPVIVLDGAHNRQSAARLRETMNEHFAGRKRVVVFGASEDKDIGGMFAELLPEADYLLLYQAHHPRAARIESLAELAGDFNCPVTVVRQADEVFPQATALAGPDGVVLVTGSLYLVGEIYPVLS